MIVLLLILLVIIGLRVFIITKIIDDVVHEFTCCEGPERTYPHVKPVITGDMCGERWVRLKFKIKKIIIYKMDNLQLDFINIQDIIKLCLRDGLIVRGQKVY